jgi:murein DD-endopeptidase MepM/ murein hydrolase activator NlpD
MSSRFTRIILIGGDDRPLREFTISHLMVALLVILGLLLAAMVAYVLVSYATTVRQAARVPGLEAELVAAEAQLARVEALELELAEMRGLQQRLLLMMGVDASLADSMAAGEAGGLGDLAGVVLASPPDAWPAAGYVTREFIEGQVAQGVRPHPGLDIAGPEGAPILAAGDGMVSRTGEDPFLGNFVEIQHGMGYVTVYGHCQSVAVGRGAQVRRGQVIAYMGETGEASAPHLHFEIWQNGMAVDPREFLEGEPAAP